MSDNSVWNRLTDQEKQWALDYGHSVEDVNDNALNTANFLRLRYAEFGFTLGEADESFARVTQDDY